MKNLLVIFFSLCFFALQVDATPQIPDELIIGSEKIDVYGFTVSDLVKKQMTVSKDKYGKGYNHTSTANHRGFVATLELKNDKLFLRKLQIRVYSEERNKAFEELSKIDSKNPKDGDKARVQKLLNVIEIAGIISVPLGFLQNKAHADWFTGELYHYHGKSLSYTYTHRLSQARVLTFKQGNLVSDWNIPVEE